MPRDWPKMADGRPYPSGTAYEIVTALQSSLSRKVPDVYIFRKKGGPALSDDEAQEREVLAAMGAAEIVLGGDRLLEAGRV